MRVTYVAAAVVLAVSLSPHAADAQQPIELSFKDGRVWLASRGATVRQILQEWERRSGATIVNGQAVEDDSLTIELEGVTERQALDVILRHTAGYIAAARQRRDDTGSTIDRIIILPASTSTVVEVAHHPETDDAADPLDSLNTLIGLAQAASSLRPER